MDELLTHFEQEENIKDCENLETHDNLLKLSLNKLADETKKGFYGMFQCLFCKHGTKTSEEISAHMAKHPSEPHLYCVRAQPSNQKVIVESFE